MALRVLRWLEGFQQPVILLLDDWGRAAHQTARLYRRIAADKSLTMLRILASERSDETLDGAQALRFSLSDFSDADLLAFVAAKLGAFEEAASDVAGALSRTGVKTPLLAASYLHRLELAGCLDPAARHFDSKQALSLLRTFAGHNPFDEDPLDTRVVRHVAWTLALLETDAQLSDLQNDASPGATEIAGAVARLEASGIVQRRDGRIDFTHDTFRDAVFSRIEDQERRERSGALAEMLRRAGVDPASAGRGGLMLRLRLAGGIDHVEPALWQQNFYLGAAAARRRGERLSAHDFSQAALDLASRRGNVDHAIWAEATLAAIEQGRHDAALRAIGVMQDTARDDVERAYADELLVYSKRMSGELDAALSAARTGLERMGVSAPRTAFSLNTASAIARALIASPHTALRRPALTGSELAREAPMMRAVHALAALLFERSPLFAAGFLARSVSPRLAAGTSAGAAAYSVICSNLGLFHRGAAWARVSDARQSIDQPLRAASMLYATNTGPRILRSRKALAERRSAVIDAALEQGELSVALYAMRDRIQDALLSATALSQTAALADDALELSAHVQDPGIRVGLTALREAIESLTDTGNLASASAFSETRDSDTDGSLSSAATTRRAAAVLEAIVAASFADHDQLVSLHQRHRVLFSGALRTEQGRTWMFATTLGLLRRECKPPRQYLAALRAFARINPESYLHRHLLIRAEQERMAMRTREALTLYERAADAASQSWLEHAIICRAAAEGASELGAARAATAFHARAIETCAKLGAPALARSLRAPELGGEPDASQTRLMDAQAAHEAAARANLARSRLLAAVSHELRTPLQGLKGLVELGDLQEPENRTALKGAVEQLSLAIDELTELAISESGAIQVAHGPIDLQQLLEGVAALARPALGEAREVLIACAAEAPRLSGDARRLQQILNNLVANAVKYGAGDITLSAKARLSGADHWLVDLIVDDEGAALSDAEWTRLFEPFERGAPTNGQSGLGLGLAISRRIAEALNGELIAEKTDRASTRFRLSIALPAWRGADASKLSIPANLTVLLAEDEPLSQRVIAALIERQGASVTVASNGEAAVRSLREHKFDVVLLDARMPGRSGIEVAAEAQSLCPDATIALMSAAMDDNLANRAKALQLICLRKPIGHEELGNLFSIHGARRRKPASDTRRQFRALAVSKARVPPADAEISQEALLLVGRILAASASGQTEEAAFLAHKLAGLSAQFQLRESLREAAAVIHAKSGLVQPDDIERLRLAGLALHRDRLA
jgi:signal transduction histidine kinase/DNA-binding NarL/FixJ family response regulator